MKRITDCIRGALLSPEFFIIVLGSCIIILEPDIFQLLPYYLSTSKEVTSYFALLPSAIFVGCISYSRTILSPSEDSSALLLDWPEYRLLKTRVFIGIAYQATFCILGLFVWIGSDFSTFTNSTLLFTAILGSVLGGATFFLASITVAEITKKFNAKK